MLSLIYLWSWAWNAPNSLAYLQISELSLVGFVVGYPFERGRAAPDVCFVSFNINIHSHILLSSYFCSFIRLFKWSFSSMIFLKQGNFEISNTHIGMSALPQRWIFIADWKIKGVHCALFDMCILRLLLWDLSQLNPCCLVKWNWKHLASAIYCISIWNFLNPFLPEQKKASCIHDTI